MAHLAHKLPWQALSSAHTLKYRTDLTPRITDLFQEEGAQKAIDAFIFALDKTIKEFAETERKKHPAKYSSRDPELFKESIWEDITPYMQDQDLDTPQMHSMRLRTVHLMAEWEKWCSAPLIENRDHPYNEVVGMLLAEHRLDALLRLAQNPKVRLDLLDATGYNYQYGFSATLYITLRAYVYLNVLYLKPALWSEGSKSHFQLYSFCRLMKEQRGHYSGDLVYLLARKRMGWPIWWHDESQEDFEKQDPFTDLERLREYLKACFQLLVDFEVLAKEINGRGANWSNIYEMATDRYSGKQGAALCYVRQQLAEDQDPCGIFD